jgi:hypothetical protein
VVVQQARAVPDALTYGIGLSEHPRYVYIKLLTIFYLIQDDLILATSVDVERVFSRGRLLLSHIRNRLSAQSTRALLCLGNWSLLGMVDNIDVLTVARLEALEGDFDFEMDVGWDRITLSTETS